MRYVVDVGDISYTLFLTYDEDMLGMSKMTGSKPRRSLRTKVNPDFVDFGDWDLAEASHGHCHNEQDMTEGCF